MWDLFFIQDYALSTGKKYLHKFSLLFQKDTYTDNNNNNKQRDENE